MTIRLLFFGVLKDLFAADRNLIELQEHSTVRDLLDLLRERGSALSQPLGRSLAVAVNRVYATPDTTLRDGDEVALLPPVSGGSQCA